MLPAAIIVFREVLEAAIIITIVLVAAKGAPRLRSWISLGVLGGVLGAAVVAVFADRIAAVFAGTGQELFNACVLFVAVAFLGWHVVWMQQHGRQLAAQFKSLGANIAQGVSPMYILAVVVGLAVLREGAEVVLFMYGVVIQGTEAFSAAAGILLGLAVGILSGALLYSGLVRISSKYLFKVTNALIVLLASGMAAQGVKYLVQADILPTLGTGIWDTSWILSERSILGRVLHTLTGYVDRPDGIQILTYILTLGILISLMRMYRSGPAQSKVKVAAVLCTGFLFLSIATVSSDSLAAYRTYRPCVEHHALDPYPDHPPTDPGQH